MKNLILALVLIISGNTLAQLSINGGGSMLMGFGNKKPFGGFHVGLEIPRDDAISIFGKFTHHFKQNAINPVPGYYLISEFDQVGNPILAPGDFYPPEIDATPSMNYNIIEGGTRYYLGNGFDYGFAAYGGSSIMLAFSKVKASYSEFNEEFYKIDENYRIDGSIFSIGFGLGGGVKYSFDRLGTLYLDLNVAYMIFSQASNSSVGAVNSTQNSQWSSLIFNFNLGFRKDIIW